VCVCVCVCVRMCVCVCAYVSVYVCVCVSISGLCYWGDSNSTLTESPQCCGGTQSEGG
jgi:hypothetical protein